MADVKKIEEALAHIKEAEKSLKTTLLKWKPDVDVAADEYNQAAICYKTAKQFDKCKECLLKAAENYKLNRSFFSAAKCLDQASNICKEMGDKDGVFTLCERAACLYQEHGTPDSAALALDRGAKIIENDLPEKALHMYRHAVDIVMTEDRPRQAAEYQCKVSRMLVKMKMYDRATDAIKREIALHQSGDNNVAIGRMVVVLVMVQIARGDIVAAEKAYREWGSYCEQEEADTLVSLLQAFDEDDGDLARRALNSPFIRHMDVEYAKLARDLPVPKTSAKPEKSGTSSYGNVDEVTKGIGNSSISTGDDEELDLC